MLDKQFLRLDSDNALRTTVLKPAYPWRRTSQADLLASPSTASLSAEDAGTERDRAFDLLDFLSRSGGIELEHVDLHVLLAATHCFDSTLIATVVQDNINPIDKVERSSLILATTIHAKPVSELVKPQHLSRLQETSPLLLQ